VPHATCSLAARPPEPKLGRVPWVRGVDLPSGGHIESEHHLSKLRFSKTEGGDSNLQNLIRYFSGPCHPAWGSSVCVPPAAILGASKAYQRPARQPTTVYAIPVKVSNKSDEDYHEIMSNRLQRSLCETIDVRLLNHLTTNFVREGSGPLMSSGVNDRHDQHVPGIERRRGCCLNHILLGTKPTLLRIWWTTSAQQIPTPVQHSFGTRPTVKQLRQR